MESNNKPSFNNKHNTMYKTEHGVKWHSRACAVVCHVWFIHNNIPYILVGKRGDVTDYPGKYNIPCGYLDWDENLQHAMYRETWEETGLDLAAVKAKYGYRYDRSVTPWSVNADPKANRQNVSMHMGMVIDLGSNELPVLSLDNMESNESEAALWLTYDEISKIPKDGWAFNHDVRINEFRLEIGKILNEIDFYKKQEAADA